MSMLCVVLMSPYVRMKCVQHNSGGAPFNQQPNGVILYTVGFHSGSTSSPAISSTIRGTLNFQIKASAPTCEQIFLKTQSITLTGAIQVPSVGPYTWWWSTQGGTSLGTSQSVVLAGTDSRLNLVRRTVWGSCPPDPNVPSACTRLYAHVALLLFALSVCRAPTRWWCGPGMHRIWWPKPRSPFIFASASALAVLDPWIA